MKSTMKGLTFTLMIWVAFFVVAPAFVDAQTSGPRGSGAQTEGPSGSGSTTEGPRGSGSVTEGPSGSGSSVTLTNPLKSIDSLPELLTAILRGIVQIGFIFLVLMIIFVGFKFVTAQGKPEELTQAKTALLWTVIGGLILLGAEAIALVIESTVSKL
jgi:hypothetical protein